MSAPLEFLRIFSSKLREANIRFAITSGMACVFYRLQQTTKDSDWIIPAEDLAKLLDLLSRLEQEMPPWRVSYRLIFGVPLEAAYMALGWTRHLSIWDRADSPEHRVDLFSKPPRVALVETGPDDPAYATRHVVAQMKRTDRPRDWPFVDGLGLQLQAQAPDLALLHIQDPIKLLDAWRRTAEQARASARKRRPLLKLLDGIQGPDQLDAWLRLERLVWETVNQERYGLYSKAWKDFFRRWRKDEGFSWPTSEPIRQQHDRLYQVVSQFGLVLDPIGEMGREALYERALRRAALRADTTADRIAEVQPPLEEVLP